MFIWWLGLSLLQMNWWCISVVNPNNNLRSLKRSLSASSLFCSNINVNIMHTIFFYERLLWRSLWKEWRLLILILSDASSRTLKRYFFLLLLINDLKLFVQYCYSSKLMLHVKFLEQLEPKESSVVLRSFDSSFKSSFNSGQSEEALRFIKPITSRNK